MRPFSRPIHVTRPLLPDLSSYAARLEAVWKSGWLSNAGRQHDELERRLAEHLRLERLSLLCNGTMALIVAARALELRGEIITTPFTFAATPQSLSWSGCEPVFADIDPDTMTLSPEAVEAAVTPRTGGILAVHVFGCPCDFRGLDAVARRYGLPIVYDGAHAFGLEVDGDPVGVHGDVTMFSFHATKLFHTAEGGALTASSVAVQRRIERLRNFCIEGEERVSGIGTNGKMNELQAALGIEVLAMMERERARRLEIAAAYRRLLEDIPGLRLPRAPAGVTRPSLQYFAVRVSEKGFGMSRDELYDALKAYNIFTRKYFHPLCSTFAGYRDMPSSSSANLPVANAVARECLTLPFYGELRVEYAERIAHIIRELAGSRCP